MYKIIVFTPIASVVLSECHHQLLGLGNLNLFPCRNEGPDYIFRAKVMFQKNIFSIVFRLHQIMKGLPCWYRKCEEQTR